MFEGSIPALITPFKKGKLDFDALSKLINWHIEQGSNGLVISGTTGESPTLDHKEHCKIIAEATKVSAGRIPIIAGVGSNCTAEALTLSRAAEDAGVDGMLHVTGYYKKPSQLQVIEHFRTIDKHTTLPILIYNIPARTGQELTVETIAVLADLKNVVGVKDLTGNVGRLTLERLKINKSFAYLSGDDQSSLGYLDHGGQGCISVTANVAPVLYREMVAAARSNHIDLARSIHERLMALRRLVWNATVSFGQRRYERMGG